MDFSFSEEQQDVGALARRILEDKATVEALREAEAGTDRFDPDLWATLADAGLLGIGLPEATGGGGYGVIEQCRVAQEVGRTVAPAPVVAHTMMGAAPIARFGSDAAKQRWLPGACDGSVILSGALAEPMNRWPDRPTTTARHDGGRWVLDGTKTCAPAAPLAQAFVVPATTDDGSVTAFVVAADADGLAVEPQQMTNGDRDGRVVLEGVTVDDDARLDGDDPAAWILERATIGLCAQQLGVVERALEMTSAYTKERVQFDRPIATFQAVGQRAADAYIDVEAVRLTLWQAAWRLSDGLPAATEVEVAKFWAAEAGHRVAHAAVHLHGGAGVDVDQPIHRYFVAAKAIEFALGGATDQLLRIGQRFAAVRE